MMRNGLRPRCILQRLGDAGGVAADERDGARADEQFGEAVDARLLGAEASQRVLVHLVLAAALAQLTAQRWRAGRRSCRGTR